MDKLNSWIALIALVVGLSSIAVSFGFQSNAHHSLCKSQQEANLRTRDFITKLLADPSVPPASRQAVTQLALQSFPVQAC